MSNSLTYLWQITFKDALHSVQHMVSTDCVSKDDQSDGMTTAGKLDGKSTEGIY